MELLDQIELITQFTQSFIPMCDEFDIRVVTLYTNHKEHCSEIISHLTRRVRSSDNDGGGSYVQCDTIPEVESNYEKFLSCFPSLSILVVQKLLQTFPTVADLVSHSMDDIASILELSDVRDRDSLNQFYELLCASHEYDNDDSWSDASHMCPAAVTPPSHRSAELDNSQLVISSTDGDVLPQFDAMNVFPAASSPSSNHLHASFTFDLNDRLSVPESLNRSRATFEDPMGFIQSCSYNGHQPYRTTAMTPPRNVHQKPAKTATTTRSARLLSPVGRTSSKSSYRTITPRKRKFRS